MKPGKPEAAMQPAVFFETVGGEGAKKNPVSRPYGKVSVKIAQKKYKILSKISKIEKTYCNPGSGMLLST